jgi:N-acetyl-alpha-D-muramate 1-phosphate uridylyltransferase
MLLAAGGFSRLAINCVAAGARTVWATACFNLKSAIINATMNIKAMILAAGRGERMRPLTDTCPKPLLAVRGKALIDWHVEALAQIGVTDFVVNTAWLGDQIETHLSSRFLTSVSNQISLQPTEYVRGQLSFSYSHEGVDFGGALETAGGVARALPLLGDVFWVLAGDVFVPGFEFSPAAVDRFTESGKLAHLWLVPNPTHNARGDFGLDDDGLARNLSSTSSAPRYTFSTIALYRKEFFEALPFGNPDGVKAPLAAMLRSAMDNGQVSAELHSGAWTDVGTPARLAELNETVI